MRPRPALASLLVVPLLFPLLVACGSDGSQIAVDGPEPIRPPAPSAPAAVHTRGLVTVMDVGRPEVCLGPIAESFPPQCRGPEIVGWDWSAHRGAFEQQGRTRWGQFAVSGTWDGQRLTLADAVPAALYDAAAPTPEPSLPAPARTLSPAELADVQEQVGRFPGAHGASVSGPRVVVDVTFDDGSLQAWADEHLGRSVVVVSSQLVPDARGPATAGRPARGSG